MIKYLRCFLAILIVGISIVAFTSCGEEGEHDKKYTVVFNLNNNLATGKPADQKIAHGGKATEPTPPPQLQGYIFRGWYKDAACTERFEFTESITVI